jgi:hypothetical protein
VGIRLVLADNPERLAAAVVAQDRDLGAEGMSALLPGTTYMSLWRNCEREQSR